MNIFLRRGNRSLRYLDTHFRPLSISCPFCSVEYDAVGKVEEFERDAKIILKELKIDVKYGLFYIGFQDFVFIVKDNPITSLDCFLFYRKALIRKVR